MPTRAIAYRRKVGYTPDQMTPKWKRGLRTSRKYNIMSDMSIKMNYQMRFTASVPMYLRYRPNETGWNVWTFTYNLYTHSTVGAQAASDSDLGYLCPSWDYFLQGFQRCRLDALRVEYIPDCTNDSAGNVYIGFTSRPDTSSNSFNSLSEISQMAPLARGDIKQPLECMWVGTTPDDKEFKQFGGGR